ncbi:hypothetical protein [Flavobacterium sp.]|uniref:hypothetical protein n=1 Tax=Flavobacterium sp. TaxID=239 RepID=UPI0035B2494F
MIKKILILIGLVSFQFSQSQSIYLNTGKNFTKFSTSKDIGDFNFLIKNSNLNSELGNSYEIGYIYNDDSTLKVSSGITYNQYNIVYSVANTATRYAWNTNYLGIQNSVRVKVFEVYDVFQIEAKLGLNTAYFISGSANALGVNYDLTSSEDFKKVIFQPLIGLTVSKPISDIGSLSLGYNFSMASSAKVTVGQFSYVNHNVQLGINLFL